MTSKYNYKCFALFLKSTRYSETPSKFQVHGFPWFHTSFMGPVPSQPGAQRTVLSTGGLELNWASLARLPIGTVM